MHLIQALLSRLAFIGIGAKSSLEYNSEARKIHYLTNNKNPNLMNQNLRN